jgi:hypothetical protein
MQLKTTKALLLSCVFTLGMYSCQKAVKIPEEMGNNTETTSVKQKAGVIVSYPIINNASNAYDQIGKDHNRTVKAVFPGMDNSFASGVALSDARMINIENTYMVSIGYDTVAANTARNFAVSNGYMTTSGSADASTSVDKIYADGHMSLTAKNYVTQILNTINTGIDESNATGDQATYNAFANNIIAIESQIINNTSLSAIEKQVLLSSTSVARNSAGYWGNYLRNLGSDPNPTLQSTSSKGNLSMQLARRKPFNLNHAITADFVGGVSCGYGGAIMGAMAGGIGAAPGCIAGAAGGAVTGSIAYTLYLMFA